MEEVCVVKHRVLVKGESMRRVARELGISRDTVKRYVSGAKPGVRADVARGSPIREQVWPRLSAILSESPRWTGGKQRLTATRLHRMLSNEGIGVSPRSVRKLVAEWKRERQEVFVPLEYRPGELAEVDFFEVLVDLGGERRKAWMFVMRLMFSGRDFAWLYPRQDQTCFLDGHVRAFVHFGAVPQRIAYDNLKAAVAKILVGSERELTKRFLALKTHYLFEASFARPYTGHDKGGVESTGRAIRWQHLVPIPEGKDLETVSRVLMVRIDDEMEHKRNREGKTVAERFAVERGLMLPVCEPPFRAVKSTHAEVCARSLVSVEGASYSVWSEWSRRSVMAHIGVTTVELVGPDGRVVMHPRQPSGKRSIDYRHYLGELAHKPQAVRQVAESLVRDLGAPYDALWRELCDEHGVVQASKTLSRVLQSVVELGEAVVSERIQVALSSGEPVLLALRPAPSPVPPLGIEALPIGLRHIEVLAGRAADYDALLGGAP